MPVTDDQAFALAMDALSSLDSIREDVSALKGVDSDILALLKVQGAEVPQPDQPEISLSVPYSALDSAQVAEVDSSPLDAFQHDLLAFQWMQTVLGVFLLVAVLLNLGASLWLSFSDKWRS